MLRKNGDLLHANEKVNGYAPEKVASSSHLLLVNGYDPEKSADLSDFIHLFVLLWTDGYQKEPISAHSAADCSPRMLNGYAPEYVINWAKTYLSLFIVQYYR